MLSFKAILEKFDKQGEKTGWTYFIIPHKTADKISPGNKKSFRVKGSIDDVKIKSVALLPMGEGDFIMPVNATMRKALGKRKGDRISISLEADTAALKISPDLITCLKDDPGAFEYFNQLPGSHKNYYSKWIESAKTQATKSKRIALAMNAFVKKMSFSQMMQAQKKDF